MATKACHAPAGAATRALEEAMHGNREGPILVAARR
jgi:hypothetical protein